MSSDEPLSTDAGFEELSSAAQVRRLRASAWAALRDYPVDVARLRLLNHGYNTTFRVDTADGAKFALRINTNSRKTLAALRAEMAWLAALSSDTDVWVPTPQRTRDGHLHAEVHSPDLGRVLPAALFAWLPGRDLRHAATPGRLMEVGRTMAALHAHTERWQLPAGAALPGLHTVLLDTPNHLVEPHAELTAARREVVSAAFAQVQQQLDSLFAGATTQVLHADLHLDNLKWWRGRLSVFDFDDCGVGVPVQDLAMSAFYLRPRLELEAALHEGYASVRPLPMATQAQYEAVVASRDLVLLNDLLVTPTAELRAMLPTYAENSYRKLRHYLATGTFRHDLPGTVTLF